MTNTGIHYNVDKNLFKDIEWEILQIFSKFWRVTANQGSDKTDFCSLLISPSVKYKELFNLNREILVCFSPFSNMDNRTIDSIKWGYRYWNGDTVRVEEVFCILVSKDKDVENKVKALLRRQEGDAIVIPFDYKEIFTHATNSQFFISRFKKYLFNRDLFGFNNPIKKESFLFGRDDLILSMVSRHEANENTGVFGLRKIGKTSVLIGIERVLRSKRKGSIRIDCEDISFQSWNLAIYFIINELAKKYGAKRKKIHTESDYTNQHKVGEYFNEDLKLIISQCGLKSILIIFDEIEHITFKTSSESNWNEGNDFIRFWKILRSSFQKENSRFTYLIAGTNPLCIEKSSINNVDNPIYLQLNPVYLPSFEIEATKKMINTLGGYLGIYFDDLVCAKLTEDFGGHPFLVRKLCSLIHRNITEDRPLIVDKFVYEKYKNEFIRTEGHQYSEQILDVLHRFYPNEYIMLEYLATGNYEAFQLFAKDDPAYTYHLINFGIIKKRGDDYYFNTELLKNYLATKNKYRRLDLSQDEIQLEISKRRNAAEIKLRKIVRNQLRAILGKEEAKKIVLKKWNGDRNKLRKYRTLSLTDLFNSEKHNIYFDDLREYMRMNYETCFKNLFETDVEIYNAKMKLINHLRKVDCHATPISEEDFMSFRGAMSWLENRIESYYE